MALAIEFAFCDEVAFCDDIISSTSLFKFLAVVFKSSFLLYSSLYSLFLDSSMFTVFLVIFVGLCCFLFETLFLDDCFAGLALLIGVDFRADFLVLCCFCLLGVFVPDLTGVSARADDLPGVLFLAEGCFRGVFFVEDFSRFFGTDLLPDRAFTGVFLAIKLFTGELLTEDFLGEEGFTDDTASSFTLGSASELFGTMSLRSD